MGRISASARPPLVYAWGARAEYPARPGLTRCAKSSDSSKIFSEACNEDDLAHVRVGATVCTCTCPLGQATRTNQHKASNTKISAQARSRSMQLGMLPGVLGPPSTPCYPAPPPLRRSARRVGSPCPFLPFASARMLRRGSRRSSCRHGHHAPCPLHALMAGRRGSRSRP